MLSVAQLVKSISIKSVYLVSILIFVIGSILSGSVCHRTSNLHGP